MKALLPVVNKSYCELELPDIHGGYLHSTLNFGPRGPRQSPAVSFVVFKFFSATINRPRRKFSIFVSINRVF